MKLAMIQANVEEDREANMARFMNDFNHDITYIMELHNYMKLGWCIWP
jgi:hypothetical protein